MARNSGVPRPHADGSLPGSGVGAFCVYHGPGAHTTATCRSRTVRMQQVGLTDAAIAAQEPPFGKSWTDFITRPGGQ